MFVLVSACVASVTVAAAVGVVAVVVVVFAVVVNVIDVSLVTAGGVCGNAAVIDEVAVAAMDVGGRRQSTTLRRDGRTRQTHVVA